MGSMQDWLAAQARVRAQRGITRHTVPRAGAALDLASNDYLGLATDPRLQAAAVAAVERHGTGARASRVVTGTHAVHEELEAELCALTGRPAALAFSSGYAANLGLLTALGGPGTLMLTDEHIHASLIDAARLSRSPSEVIPHGDLAVLEQRLAARSQPRAVVVIESIYSVFGDAADVSAVARLCADHDALLVVDEAHGIGVAGHGRGAVYAAGLAERGACGGDRHTVQGPGQPGRGRARLPRAARASGQHRAELHFRHRTGLLPRPPLPRRPAASSPTSRSAWPPSDDNAALLAAGLDIEQAAGAVQSVPVGSPQLAAELAARLEEAGVLVGCFRPPSVPDGISRLRLTARADLAPEQLRYATGLINTMLSRTEVPA